MAKRARPGPLTAIAIIGIALGGLGVCVSTSGIASQASQGALQEFQRTALEAQHGAGSSEARRQIEMQERIQEAAAPYVPFSIAHQILNLLASLALLVAGVLLFRWHPAAPALFTGVAVANLALDVVGGTLGMMVQLASSDAVAAYMESAAVGGNEQVMGAMAEATAGMGICTAVALFVVKAGYYVWGIVYLRKPEVRAGFRPEAPAEAAAPDADPPVA